MRRFSKIVAWASALVAVGFFVAALFTMPPPAAPEPLPVEVVVSGQQEPHPQIPHHAPPPAETNRALMLGMIGVAFGTVALSAALGAVLMRIDEESSAR